MTIFHIVWAIFGTVDYSWFLIVLSEVAMISSGCEVIPTEVETRSQVRRQRAVVTRRLVTLAGFVPVPFASSSLERSRELLEEAFDNGMNHFSVNIVWSSMVAHFLWLLFHIISVVILLRLQLMQQGINS